MSSGGGGGGVGAYPPRGWRAGWRSRRRLRPPPSELCPGRCPLPSAGERTPFRTSHSQSHLIKLSLAFNLTSLYIGYGGSMKVVEECTMCTLKVNDV